MSRGIQRFRALLYALEQQQGTIAAGSFTKMLAPSRAVQPRLTVEPLAPTCLINHAGPVLAFRRSCYIASPNSIAFGTVPGRDVAASVSKGLIVGGTRTFLTSGTTRDTSTAATRISSEVGPEQQDDAATSTLDVWYDFLRFLHEQGDFGGKDTPCELLIQQHDDVKDAIVAFSRRRPDIIFSLPPLEVAAVAEAELLSRDLPDRKLRNADRRLKYTFVSGRYKAPGASAGAGEGGHFHATMQDLMRVLRDWAVAPQPTVDAAAPGLTQALRHLLRCIRQLAVSEPDAAAVQRASRLGTPTAVELQERLAAREPPEERRKTKEAAFLERRHRLRVRDAVRGGVVVESGDWFCANCGAVNWRDKSRCFRCAAPSDKSGNTVVTPQDIAEVYGDRPPRRRPRAAAASADADAIYQAQAARAAVAAEGAAAGAASVSGSGAGGAGRLGLGKAPGRRAPVQLGGDDGDDDDGYGDAGAPMRADERSGPGAGPSRGGGGPSGRGEDPRVSSRAGRSGAREEVRGRPGLRRRVPAGGEEEDDLDLDVHDDDGGPYTSEARASPAWQRSLREYYDDGEGDGDGPDRGRGRGGRSGRSGSVPTRGYDEQRDERGRGGRDPRDGRSKAGGGGGGARPAARDLGDLEFEEWEASSVSPSSRGRTKGPRGGPRPGGGGGAAAAAVPAARGAARADEGRRRAASYLDDDDDQDDEDGGDVGFGGHGGRGRGGWRGGGGGGGGGDRVGGAERWRASTERVGGRSDKGRRSGQLGWLDAEEGESEGDEAGVEAARNRGRGSRRVRG